MVRNISSTSKGIVVDSVRSPEAWPLNDHDNITQLLERAAQRRPRSAFVYPLNGAGGAASFCTYPTLLNEARCILGGLCASGLRPGQRVGLLLEHPQDFIEAFWACTLGGYVPCPL